MTFIVHFKDGRRETYTNWDNFKRYLEDNNMILIVEMEW